ncbi:MAG: recombinase family protein [Candidatus Margulisiibacteriota bacterium]
MKAVSYARVSSTEQRDSGYSISAQNSLFKDYADQKSFEVVKQYDESYSAKGQGRKMFDEMIRYVKKHKVKAILFEKVDRMTRNFHDLIAVYDLVEEHDVDVHLIKNSLILNKNSKSQDKFQLDIQVVLARNYVNNLSEEVKKGMTQKLMAGGWCHLAPPGYRNVRINGRATIEPDPQSAPVIKTAFEMAKAGDSVHTITDYLNKTLGTKYYPSKVSYHLKNVFYIGEINSKLGLFSGNYETFIEPELFYAVQEGLKGRHRSKDGKVREFRFSSLLKCSCGSPMYGELKKEKYVTYGCGAKHKGRTCPAQTRYFSERAIMEQLDTILSKVSITDTQFDMIKDIARTVFQQMDDDTDKQSDTINRDIKLTKTKIMKLLDHYEDGLLTKDEYLDRKDQLNQTLVKLQAKYEVLAQNPIRTRTSFMDLVNTFVFVRKYLPLIDDAGDFQKVIGLIFTNLVHNEGKLEFELNLLGKMLFEFVNQDVVGPLGLEPRTNRL